MEEVIDMNKKSLIIFGSIFAVLIIALAVALGMSSSNNKQDTAAENEATNEIEPLDTTPIEGQQIVYLGEEDAANEIFLAFDYSCPYCKQWMGEVLPQLEKDYIDEGKAKFRMQPMVFLNDTSQRLANFDQNLVHYNKDNYFKIARRIMEEAEHQEEATGDWGTDQYVNNIIADYGLDQEKMLQEPERDSINVTRKYTRALGVETVPSVFVNGKRVENPFDVNEITALLDQ